MLTTMEHCSPESEPVVQLRLRADLAAHAIRLICEDHHRPGQTMRSVGARCGINHATVHHFMRGRAVPSITIARKIIAAYGAT